MTSYAILVVWILGCWLGDSDTKPLFNGENLQGWETVGRSASGTWVVEDGVLWCKKKGGWLRSTDQYGDFTLDLEYLVRPGGNSGVFLRVPADGDHHGKGAGVEVQILDDDDPRYEDLEPSQYCGSVYAVAPSYPRVGLPSGRWNRLEIHCRGTHYRVVHNGVVVVDAKAKQFPELAGRRVKGYLGLQNHGGGVAFRNLRIGPLKSN